MTGKDNCTTAAHGGALFGSETADPAGILAVCSRRSGRSSTEQPCSWGFQGRTVCLDAGAPGETVSGAWGLSGLHRAKIGCISGVQEAFRWSTGGAGGRKKSKKPLFCAQQGWLGRHLSGKQPVKDSGVCRVIGTISRGSRRCKFSLSHPKSAFPYAHIGRNRCLAPFLCLIRAI